jgi:hypothetical protein
VRHASDLARVAGVLPLDLVGCVRGFPARPRGGRVDSPPTCQDCWPAVPDLNRSRCRVDGLSRSSYSDPEITPCSSSPRHPSLVSDAHQCAFVTPSRLREFACAVTRTSSSGPRPGVSHLTCSIILREHKIYILLCNFCVRWECQRIGSYGAGRIVPSGR